MMLLLQQKNQLHSYEKSGCSLFAPRDKVIQATRWILVTIIKTQNEAQITQPYLHGNCTPKRHIFDHAYPKPDESTPPLSSHYCVCTSCTSTGHNLNNQGN